jgi:hypothetical protein
VTPSKSDQARAGEAGEAGMVRRPPEGVGHRSPQPRRQPARGGRRPGPGPRPGALLAAAVALVAGAALLAACGGSSGGASSASATSAAAAPSPMPSPIITSGAPPAAAVDVVRRFWTDVGRGRLAQAQRSLVAPGSPLRRWNGEDIVAARFVRLVPHSVGGSPEQGATLEFSAIVWVDAGSADSPWGPTGDHQLFEHVVRMSDGTWKMWDSGTGP